MVVEAVLADPRELDRRGLLVWALGQDGPDEVRRAPLRRPGHHSGTHPRKITIDFKAGHALEDARQVTPCRRGAPEERYRPGQRGGEGGLWISTRVLASIQHNLFMESPTWSYAAFSFPLVAFFLRILRWREVANGNRGRGRKSEVGVLAAPVESSRNC